MGEGIEWVGVGVAIGLGRGICCDDGRGYDVVVVDRLVEDEILNVGLVKHPYSIKLVPYYSHHIPLPSLATHAHAITTSHPHASGQHLRLLPFDQRGLADIQRLAPPHRIDQQRTRGVRNRIQLQ